MKLIKRISIGVLTMMMVMMVMMGFMFWNDVKNPYDLSISKESVPMFEVIPIDIEHNYDEEKSHALKGTALIDIDNDGVDEVFAGNGYEHDDIILKYTAEGFKDITAETNFPSKGGATTYGALSCDMDNNGSQDLIIGREDGLHLYLNNNGKFNHTKINATFDDKTIPLGLTAGDINQDGFIDLFVAGYVKRGKMEGLNNFTAGYGGSSLLLLNNGDNTFKDITKAAGLEYVHNTFQGILVDMNNDSYLDLVVAYDTGEPRVYKNNGNNTFTMKDNPLTNNHLYPMGIAVGDYNNDGLTDIFFTNSGSSMPTFIVRGNLKKENEFTEKWSLFENKGNFVFENVADKTKVADYEFSWGACFADLNNDMRQDLLVAQNWADFPPHKMFTLPGRVLMQNENGEFVSIEELSGSANPHFGISPMVSDFNNDGHLDIFWSNIAGPLKAFLNKGGNNNFFRLRLDQDASTIGAKALLVTKSGRKIAEDLIIGEGLSSDQSSTLHFGLGTETAIEHVIVQYPSGKLDTLTNPEINSTVYLRPIAMDL